MPGNETKESGTGSTFVDVITSRVAKIGALLTALVALITVATSLLVGVEKIVSIVRPAKIVASKECLELKLGVQPATVSVGKWRAVQFDLTGRNACDETLPVYVVFKSLNGDMRIEPFNSFDQATCRNDDSGCWESVMLDRKKPVKWKLTPPRLTQLSTLVDPESMDVTWIVYKAGTKEQLESGKFPITVQRDAP